MGTLSASQQCIDLIKRFEGCRLEAYKCPAGVWTIGYGHTSGVKQGQKITQEQAEAFLRTDLARYEDNVNKYYTKYIWYQHEFDALVSFAYNIGGIEQLTAHGTRTKAVIADKMLEYNKAGGQVLPGLAKRRQAERELFLIGSDNAAKELSTIRKGSTGVAVTYLQNSLIKIGYDIGKVDGVFGIRTEAAVIDYQSKNGLKTDGIVGPKTWNKLLVIK